MGLEQSSNLGISLYHSIIQIIKLYFADSDYIKVHVLFGKKVEDSLTGDGLGRMYSLFLKYTSITSKKKTHLARRTMPTILEEMGCVFPCNIQTLNGN